MAASSGGHGRATRKSRTGRAPLSRRRSRHVAPLSRGRAGRWNMNGNGSRQGNPAALGACVRRCSTAKRGECRHSLGSAWIRRRSPEYAQCPSARHLGTLGAMIHGHTERTAGATGAYSSHLDGTSAHLSKPAQPCPARPVAFPVLGRMRDTLSHAVEHDGCPRYAGRLDVDSTRSAAFPLRPPDALGEPLGFQPRDSSRLTAWRRASWRQARSVGHSAAGSLSPMQGQHETRQHETQHQHQQTETRAAASLLTGARPGAHPR